MTKTTKPEPSKRETNEPIVVQRRTANEAWLGSVLSAHARLTHTVVSLTQNMLTARKIEFLSIDGRTKTLQGALEKIERKQYRNPTDQLTDISGIRIVTFLESQVENVAKVIRELFEVDERNSLDRSKILGSDKIGYRSTHFVCSLSSDRERLPEYESLGNLKFEIQVRTVLQHGWAELAHDRSFKFGPGLPTHIQRKLNLYSGMLEVVDEGFDAIARDIDAYSASLSGKTLDQISNEEISRLTLEKYLISMTKKYKVAISDYDFTDEIFDELKAFGIRTSGDLEKITDDESVIAYKSRRESDTAMGFVRQIMMLKDIDRYFSGPFEWSGLDAVSYDRLLKKYDRKKLDRLLSIHGIEMLDEDYGDEFLESSFDDNTPF